MARKAYRSVSRSGAGGITKNGITATPAAGTGDGMLTITGVERTGRNNVQASFTATLDKFPSIKKSFDVVQKGKPEFITLNDSSITVANVGEYIVLTGVSNSARLTVTFNNGQMVVLDNYYKANGVLVGNGENIPSDPGSSAQYTFEVAVSVKENPDAQSRQGVFTITTANGESASCVFTQNASVFTYSLSAVADVSVIGAGGGSSTITGTYSTYRNGVQINHESVVPTCSIPAGSAFSLTGNKVSAPNRGVAVGDARSVVVSVSYGNASNTVTVSQEKNEAIYGEVTMTVDTNVSIPSSGGDYTIVPATSQTVSYTSGSTRVGNVVLSYAVKSSVTGFSLDGNKVTVTPNPSASVRDGFIVTVTAAGEGSKSAVDDVYFSQAKAEPYLDLLPATLIFEHASSNSDVTVKSNTSWKISTFDPIHLTVSPETLNFAGNGSSLDLTIESNGSWDIG